MSDSLAKVHSPLSLTVGLLPPSAGDMKTPQSTLTEDDRRLAVAQKLATRARRIITGEDILGVELDGVPKSSDFPALYDRCGPEKLRKFAVHQQKLSTLDKLIRQEKVSGSIHLVATDLFDMGDHYARMNRVFLELHLENVDFRLLRIQHARSERLKQFCFLGDGKIVDDLWNKNVRSNKKFLKALPQGVILGESLMPFKVTNKDDLKRFIKHLETKEFTVLSALGSPGDRNVYPVLQAGKKTHQIIADKLKAMIMVETPLLEWLREREQKQNSSADQKSVDNSSSVTTVENADFTMEQLLAIAKEILLEDKNIVSSQDIFDRAKHGSRASADAVAALFKEIGYDRFKQAAEQDQKRSNALSLVRKNSAYTNNEKCIAVTECLIGECDEKCRLAFVKLRIRGIKDIAIIATRQNRLPNPNDTTHYGHNYILLGVKKSEIESLVKEVKDPIEFLKRLKKGVLLDPFFKIACKVEDEKAWQPLHTAYNKAFSIDTIVAESIQYGVDLSQQQAVKTMENGKKLHSEVLKNPNTNELPIVPLMAYFSVLGFNESIKWVVDG